MEWDNIVNIIKTICQKQERSAGRNEKLLPHLHDLVRNKDLVVVCVTD
jgi:hypothetical protein